MVQRVGGSKRKTRAKLKKNIRAKGKLSIKKYLQEFKEGAKVSFLLDPTIHKGEFHPRFYGKTGIVKGKKGECYNIEIKDGNKTKTVFVHPVHLKGM